MMQLFKSSTKETMNFLRYVGPGLLVTVGFIDPGNWASNIAAGWQPAVGVDVHPR